MAMTLTNHLELRRTEHQHHYVEKMLKGIGLFVEGKLPLRRCAAAPIVAQNWVSYS
jgi:hypothetical protein